MHLQGAEAFHDYTIHDLEKDIAAIRAIDYGSTRRNIGLKNLVVAKALSYDLSPPSLLSMVMAAESNSS